MKNSKGNKQLKCLFLLSAYIILVGSCSQKQIQTSITATTIININGGAIINYKLLNADSVAYVLAKYTIRDNVLRETKSPVNINRITLEGFSRSKKYEVKLYAVTKSGGLSVPISVFVHPKTPPLLMVRQQLKIEPDYGGIRIMCANRQKSKIEITLLRYDSTSNLENIIDSRFFSNEDADYTIRDQGGRTQRIGIYVSDLYGNHTDTLIRKITALIESPLDKNKFKAYPLASDTENGYNWFLPYLWDGKTDGSSNGWHTNPAKKLPILCTFSLGTLTSLSHFVIWERPDEYCYKLGNPKDFSIWGATSKTPKDASIPVSAPVGSVVGDWVNLGNYHYPDPPSGSKPGSTVASDNSFVKAGVSFEILQKNYPVRVVRVAIANTWSGVNYAHIMELSFYGKGDALSPKN